MTRRLLHTFSLFVCACTWLLIIAGGLVTSTGSGLSVPDWPLSYGQFFPPMIGGIRFEHTHRVIAAIVGLLTLALTVFFLKKEKRGWVRGLAVAASAAVLAQALLGGITVKYLLPDAVSVAHACLGQSFFCLLAVLAYLTSGEWDAPPAGQTPHANSFRRLALTTAVFMYLQLIAGAVVRHTEGRGIELHLFLAFFILVHAVFLNVRALKDPVLLPVFFKQLVLMDALLIAQLFLGLGSFVFKLVLEKAPVPRLWEVLFTTAHQSTGALLLMNGVLMTLRAFRSLRGQRGGYPSEYMQLSKPRVTLMALVTAWVGYVLAAPAGPLPAGRLGHTLLGAFLIGAGANALNQFFERDADAKMKRTENRPLPSGRLDPQSAQVFGWTTSLLGIAELFLFVGPLCGFLGLTVLWTYAFCYTPLKRVTTLNTFVGAVSGALPIALGYVAGGGRSLQEVGALFLILFLWQLPHFFAIAWVYREDYRRGGFKMLPSEDRDGGDTARHIVFYSALLVPATLLPHPLGMTGELYGWAAAFAGGALFAFALVLQKEKLAHSKKFAAASIYYLAVLMVFLVADKR